jgi:hypothetical protein
MLCPLHENVITPELSLSKDHVVSTVFISTLLNRCLAKEQNEIIVDFNEMVCDKSKRFDLYTNINVCIENERITENDWSYEIAMSGTMENRDGKTRQFHFYLVTSWVPFRAGAFSGDTRRVNHSDFLQKQGAGAYEYVSDAVFEIALFQRDAKGSEIYVGHGRGFMVLTEQS